MERKSIKTTYREVEIEYREWENDWYFTLRGRERSASSLKLAKEAIDKPAPKKSKPFDHFEAWHFRYSSEAPASVTVMSVVARENRWSNSQRLRVKGKEGQCEEDAATIFPKNAVNDELVRQIIGKLKEIEVIKESIASLKERLVPCVIEKEPEESPTE